MKIRFAEENDITQLIDLCEAHAIYEKVVFDRENKEELLSKCIFESKYGIKCLVVEENNALMGYATFVKQFSTWDAEFYVYLDCLYLTEETRGKGIGGKIMNRIKQYAVAEGCNVIQWQTPYFNTDAIRFYKKIGGKSKTKERFFWEV